MTFPVPDIYNIKVNVIHDLTIGFIIVYSLSKYKNHPYLTLPFK